RGAKAPLTAGAARLALPEGDNIPAEPLQVLEKRRLGGHVAAAFEPLLVRIVEIGMHAGFEIGKHRIGGVEHVAHLQIVGLAKDRDRPCHHDIAEQRDSLPGIVSHVTRPYFFARYSSNSLDSCPVTAAGVAESRTISPVNCSPVIGLSTASRAACSALAKSGSLIVASKARRRRSSRSRGMPGGAT